MEKPLLPAWQSLSCCVSQSQQFHFGRRLSCGSHGSSTPVYCARLENCRTHLGFHLLSIEQDWKIAELISDSISSIPGFQLSLYGKLERLTEVSCPSCGILGRDQVSLWLHSHLFLFSPSYPICSEKHPPLVCL